MLLKNFFVSILTTVVVLAGTGASKIYKKGDPISVGVKPLTPGGGSFDEALYLNTVDFYYPTLGSCPPVGQPGRLSNESHVLQEDALFQNNLVEAPIKATFMENIRCQHECDKVYSLENISLIHDLIEQDYRLNFFLDDIPVGKDAYDVETNKFFVKPGIPLGYLDFYNVPHLFNHFQFIVYYKNFKTGYEILHVTVTEQSLNRPPKNEIRCHLEQPVYFSRHEQMFSGTKYSYEFFWKETNKYIGNKWDIYRNDIVRPLILNVTLMLFLSLVIIVGGFSYATYRKATTYERASAIRNKKTAITQIEEDNVNSDDLGLSWPSLALQVQRRPGNFALLSLFVSVGTQITTCAISLSVFYLLGGIQIHRLDGYFTKVSVVLFFITTPLGSALNSYLNKLYFESGNQLTIAAALDSFAVPLLLTPMIYWYNWTNETVGSPYRVTWSLFFKSCEAYAAISVCSFLASYKYFTVPTRKVSEIERQVPHLPITFRTIPNVLIFGIAPFSIMVVPLSRFYLTLWYHHTYSDTTVSWFLFILIAMIVVTANLNIYYSLCVGNWRWGWLSFLSGSSIGLFCFAYSFHLTKYNFGNNASLHLFLIQDLTISTIFALIGGSLSFLTGYWLTLNLYKGLN